MNNLSNTPGPGQGITDAERARRQEMVGAAEPFLDYEDDDEEDAAPLLAVAIEMGIARWIGVAEKNPTPEQFRAGWHVFWKLAGGKPVADDVMVAFVSLWVGRLIKPYLAGTLTEEMCDRILESEDKRDSILASENDHTEH